MGSSGSGAVDCSVGSIVWVRRRNGSWWPGRILGPEELAASNITLRRSGTPVKLLGREDASVDWYNFEKSERVKAFRCGEFDDCIERAEESSQGMPIKKREKYARREDAILHALELEKELLRKQGKLVPERGRSKTSTLEKKELVTLSGGLDVNNRKPGNSKSSQTLKREDTFSTVENGIPLYLQKAEEGNRPSWEDDQSEVLPQMRGMQDFGCRTGTSKRKLTASDSSAKAMTDGNCGASPSCDLSMGRTCHTNGGELMGGISQAKRSRCMHMPSESDDNMEKELSTNWIATLPSKFHDFDPHLHHPSRIKENVEFTELVDSDSSESDTSESPSDSSETEADIEEVIAAFSGKIGWKMPPKGTQGESSKRTSKKGKERVTQEEDLAQQYGAPFPIHTQEEGKKFLTLVHRKVVAPRIFYFSLLAQMRIKDRLEELCTRLGWEKLIAIDFSSYEELIWEFFTTLSYDPIEIRELQFRLKGKPCRVDYDLMKELFGLPKGGRNPRVENFSIEEFWHTITGDNNYNPKDAPTGLIRDVCYLLLHKFLSHNIFAKLESNKCSSKELFILWCLHTGVKVSTTFHIFQTMIKISNHSTCALGLGQFITGLALHFNIDISDLTPIENEVFSQDSLIRAEILNKRGHALRDLDTRTTMRNRKVARIPRVPTPRSLVVDNENEKDSAPKEEQQREEGQHEEELAPSTTTLEGWEVVLARLDQYNIATDRRLNQMDGQMRSMARLQRRHMRQFNKFLQQSGVQIPSPTPSPPESP